MDHPIHGEIYMLKELFEPYTLMPTNEVVVGKCIRTSGILKQILITNELCIIEHEGSSLLIDLKLVDMGSLIEDHLYQFLGELKGRFEKVSVLLYYCEFYHIQIITNNLIRNYQAI